MSGFDNEVVYADGIDLSGGSPVSNKLATDGFLYIGNASGNPVAALPTSSDSSITWAGGNGSLDAVVDTTSIPAIATTYITDSGSAVPVLNVLTVTGGTGIDTSAAGSTVTVTLETPVVVANGGTGAATLTDGGILLGSGTGAVTVTGQPTDGQLLIGSTGTDPVLGSLASSGGTVTITPGAGTINLEVTDGTYVDSFTTDSAGPVTPSAAGVVDVTGTSVFSDGSVANTITLNVQATAQTFLVGAGAGSTATEFGPLTNGQLIIGSTGVAPVAAALTSTDGSVNITNGAGSIDLEVNDLVKTNDSNGEGTHNLGLTYSAGTATIAGADGAALSASNPGYLTIRTFGSSGILKTYELTANFTFDDSAGTSDFAGSLFGFDTGDATEISTGLHPVFYLYAAAENSTGTVDTNPTFFVSRMPAYQKLTNVNNTGDADDDQDIQALTSVTTANYVDSRCILIGSFSMAKTAGDDWTIQTIDQEFGITRYAGFSSQTQSRGVMGAVSNSFFLANGGTAPTCTIEQYKYSIDILNNLVTCNAEIVLGGSPASAVDAQMILPIVGQNFAQQIVGQGWFYDGGDAGNVHPILFEREDSSRSAARYCHLLKGNGTTARWQYEEFASGDIIKFTFSYRML